MGLGGLNGSLGGFLGDRRGLEKCVQQKRIYIAYQPTLVAPSSARKKKIVADLSMMVGDI